MVVFDELRITEDGKYLIINAHLRKEIVEQDYANRIDEIWVWACDSSQYKEGVPSDANPIGVKVYSWSTSASPRHTVDIKVNPLEFDGLPSSFKNKMLFVYVNVFTTEEPVLSCGCASNPTIGVALDMGLIYNQFMRYINELNRPTPCGTTIPQGFTDFILRFNALLLAMDSKHYKKGIEFFDKWFSKDSKLVSSSNCSCHG